ncbi:MAG: DUF7665 family protein [Methylovirgula sp.]
MGEDSASLSRETLEAHLESVRFVEGAERGRWQSLHYAWPHLYVRVTATASGVTFSHDFHIECHGYPDPGPFVERWAFANNSSAGSRPAAPTAASASPGFVDAMKDWHENNSTVHGGIYRVWQRLASKHNGWAAKRPDEAWHRNRTIVFIMEHLVELVSEQAAWLASRPA